jgi:hypothetical protein
MEDKKPVQRSGFRVERTAISISMVVQSLAALANHSRTSLVNGDYLSGRRGLLVGGVSQPAGVYKPEQDKGGCDREYQGGYQRVYAALEKDNVPVPEEKFETVLLAV